MRASTGADQDPGDADRDPPGAGHWEHRSLLGIYPAPAPHLVGAGRPPTPEYPSRWQPPLPPLQYGIDYTFLRYHGTRPLRWRPALPITVRVAGSHRPEQGAVTAAVVAELADLTGLDLRAGEPRPKPLALRAVPEQEVQVRFVAALPAGPAFRPCADRAGSGGAVASPGTGHYRRGLAIIATTARPSASDEIAVLRHELAHALGLGHAARPGLLMYHRISVATIDFGRGDRHGLLLLKEDTQKPVS